MQWCVPHPPPPHSRPLLRCPSLAPLLPSRTRGVRVPDERGAAGRIIGTRTRGGGGGSGARVHVMRLVRSPSRLAGHCCSTFLVSHREQVGFAPPPPTHPHPPTHPSAHNCASPPHTPLPARGTPFAHAHTRPHPHPHAHPPIHTSALIAHAPTRAHPHARPHILAHAHTHARTHTPPPRTR